MALDLTPVVDAMARTHTERLYGEGAFDALGPLQQWQWKQNMLDLLAPAIPSLEVQVTVAAEELHARGES